MRNTFDGVRHADCDGAGCRLGAEDVGDSAEFSRDAFREVVPARPSAKDAVPIAALGVVSLLTVCVMALIMVSGIDLFGGRLGTLAVCAVLIVVGLRGVWGMAPLLFGKQVLTVGGGRASVHLELLGMESRRRTISVAQDARARVAPGGHGRAEVLIDGRSLGSEDKPAVLALSCMTHSQAQQCLERLNELRGFGLGDPSNKRIEPTRQA